jgi:hypothetical protein
MSPNEIIYALQSWPAKIAELNELLKADRAELARLRAENEDLAIRSGLRLSALDHEKLNAEAFKARAEKAEAALHALRLVCVTSDADKFATWLNGLNVEIAKREQAEAERDRADAEVAALKKVLLEFGQLKGTK